MRTVGDDPNFFAPRPADERAAAILVDRRRAVPGGLDALRAHLRSTEIAAQAGDRIPPATRRLHDAVRALLADE